VPGAKYRLNAWAMSAHDPRGVELALAYVDSYGDEVGVSRTTGDVSGVNPTSFRLMSVVMTAPPTAIAARVTVRVAGGSVETSTGPVAGTSVVLDDMSLARPQVYVTTKANRTTAYRTTTISLSGVVAPASAVGSPAVIYMQKPGSSWSKLATVTVGPAGSAGAWRRSYTFKRTMPSGTYRFRAYVPAIPEYLGATSSSASVRVR